jgi:hypothetical protein
VISNSVRGRLNAAFFRLIDRYLPRVLGARKVALFAALPGEVVELGPGTGANIRYYRRGTRLVAMEPNPHMHTALARAATRRGVDRGTALAGLQQLLRRGLQWAFEGCDLCRPTGALLTAAGFIEVDLEHYRMGSLFLPVNEQVAGVATV